MSKCGRGSRLLKYQLMIKSSSVVYHANDHYIHRRPMPQGQLRRLYITICFKIVRYLQIFIMNGRQACLQHIVFRRLFSL